MDLTIPTVSQANAHLKDKGHSKAALIVSATQMLAWRSWRLSYPSLL